jgi:hypothetical protein
MAEFIQQRLPLMSLGLRLNDVNKVKGPKKLMTEKFIFQICCD